MVGWVIWLRVWLGVGGWWSGMVYGWGYEVSGGWLGVSNGG